MKDLLPNDVSRAQVAAETDSLLLEYRQILAGRNVNKPVEAHGYAAGRVIELVWDMREALGGINPQNSSREATHHDTVHSGWRVFRNDEIRYNYY